MRVDVSTAVAQLNLCIFFLFLSNQSYQQSTDLILNVHQKERVDAAAAVNVVAENQL